MDEKIENSIFDEIHAQKERIEELERQVATLMTTVQAHANALKIILTAAKIAHDKGGDNDGIRTVPGG